MSSVDSRRIPDRRGRYLALTEPDADEHAGASAAGLRELETLASQIMMLQAGEFGAGGTQDEVTVRNERPAVGPVTLRARFPSDVRSRDVSTRVLGLKTSLPVRFVPIGRHQVVQADGELPKTDL